MRHAGLVIDLLARNPGVELRLEEIVRDVGAASGLMPLDLPPPADERSTQIRKRTREAVKKAVQRVLEALQRTGTVIVTPAHKPGGRAGYRWIGERRFASAQRAVLVARRLVGDDA